MCVCVRREMKIPRVYNRSKTNDISLNSSIIFRESGVYILNIQDDITTAY